MKPRIMYIENKTTGEAFIGLCRFSQTGKSVYYRGKELKRLSGGGIKGNHMDVQTGEEYWISGPKKAGGDCLYLKPVIEIDEDVQEEYWTRIRELPENVGVSRIS